jgi:hypothetical protein
MKVGLLTLEQKNEIIGQLYADDSYFNPIEDLNNDWVISTQEMDECVVEEFMWVKDLPLIDYEPKPTPPFSPIA